LGDDAVNILSIRLPEPMRVEQTTAMSWEFQVTGAESSREVEYWAATSECGSTGALQRFYAQEAPKMGVHCASITPDTAFTYIIRLMRPSPNPNAKGGLTPRGVTLCMSGTCPAP
jgi:hypothetical protein